MQLNVMMDPRPVFPDIFHPVIPDSNRKNTGYPRFSRRTKHPVKYYIIDFGLCRKFNADDTNPLDWPAMGGDKTVPEFGLPDHFDDSVRMNPFPTDIYYAGNIVRESFFEVRHWCATLWRIVLSCR